MPSRVTINFALALFCAIAFVVLLSLPTLSLPIREAIKENNLISLFFNTGITLVAVLVVPVFLLGFFNLLLTLKNGKNYQKDEISTIIFSLLIPGVIVPALWVVYFFLDGFY